MHVELTEHVLLRYIERFNPNLNSIADVKDKLNRAKKAVIEILKSAHYVSDDHRGVLLHSQLHRCNLIVRSKKLITLYEPNQKVKLREERHHNAGNR